MADLLARLQTEADDRRPSVIALVAANALPLLGVMFLGWRAFDVVLLYWMENVIIGAVNVLKILTCAPDATALGQLAERLRSQTDDATADQIDEAVSQLTSGGATAAHLSKLFFAPFFAVHYGGFCFVHGIFVCGLLGGDGPFGVQAMIPYEPALEALRQPGMLLSVIALAASHLFSYFVNYLGRGEYRRSIPPTLMFQPYARVIVLHVAIIAGGFLTTTLGSPIWLLVLVVVGKTCLDIVMHLHEHRDKMIGSPAERATTD